MGRFRTLIFCALLLSSSSVCWALNEGLDVRLALSFAEQRLALIDGDPLSGKDAERVSAIKRCFEAMRKDDIDTAREELKAAQTIAGQASHDKESMLCELEAVAAAALLLPEGKLEDAANLLLSLPAKSMPGPEASKAACQLASNYNYLRVRLLCAAGEYRDAHSLIDAIYQERKKRLGESHRDTLTAAVDFFGVALITRGGEAIYSSTKRFSSIADKYEVIELANDLVAIHARVLVETGRYEQAIELVESRIDGSSVVQPLCKTHMLTTVSLSYYGLGQYKEAIALAKDICEMCEAKGIDRYKALYALGMAQAALGRAADAKQTNIVLMAGLKELGLRQPITFADFGSLTGELFFRAGRPEGAIKVLRKIYKACYSRGWQGPARGIAFKLGVILHKSGRYAEASQCLAALKPQPTKGELSPYSKKYLTLYCFSLQKLDKWEQSYTCLNTIKSDFQGLQNSPDVALAIYHAKSVGHCGDWPKSIQLSKSILKQVTAWPVEDQKNNIVWQVHAWRTLVEAQIAAKDDDAARISLEKAMQVIIQEVGRSPEYIAWFVNQQGELAMRQQKYSDAKSFFSELANICKELKASLQHRDACAKRDRAAKLAASQISS